MSRKRLPRGFRRNADESIVCKHRDLSCCPACAAAHEEIVDVVGAHFWVPDPAERAQLEDEIVPMPKPAPIADALAKLEARANSNVRPAGYTCRAPWTSRSSGHREGGWHEHICEMKLDKIEASGPLYKLVRCLSETGAPPTNPRPAPSCMGIAWFAIPEYLASGQIKVLPTEPSLSEATANGPAPMRATYEACEESDIPSGVLFEVAPEFAGRAVQIAFSTDGEFKRVQTVPTGRTTYFKRGAAKDLAPLAARAFDAANEKRASRRKGAR